MLEADTYFLMGLVFASFVSLSSMDSFRFFEIKPGYEWVADAVVILWVGVAMSFAAWMKQWMGASFNEGFEAPALTGMFSEAHVQPRYLATANTCDHQLTRENSLQYVRHHSLFGVRGTSSRLR
jgi:hypothetical protein